MRMSISKPQRNPCNFGGFSTFVVTFIVSMDVQQQATEYVQHVHCACDDLTLAQVRSA